MKLNPYNELPKYLKFDSLKKEYPSRAVIYIKVNNCDSESGHKSEVLQYKKCTSFIKEMGWNLIQIFQDDETNDDEFANLGEMVEEGYDNRFDYIVCTSLDRLPKDLPHFLSELILCANPPEIVPLECYSIRSRKVVKVKLLPKYCSKQKTKFDLRQA